MSGVAAPRTERAPLLELRAVTKNYGAVRALNAVGFSLAAGELCGIIGPNGSGKSTLFDCCTGLQALDAGRIVLDGTDVTGWPMNRVARDGRMLRSFQKASVFDTLSAEENLVAAGQMFAFPGVASTFSLGAGARTRLAELRARAAELIDLVGLAHVRDLPAGTLSYGQQKLVQFASMLMPRPKIVLLDEPLAGINPVLIEKIATAIAEANRRLGIAFVVIEHNVDVVMGLCRRVIVLHQGEVLADGSPEAIVNDARVVEAYLGG
ncbi:MAG: ABC transporter ATP-binding protein [Alphaproteobacteria bacterium]|nr:ABC transporter ATP-binding protein [Alphaproteobacteria bacterium]